jgi:cysteinyl-tRNA synthetase
MYIYDTIQKKKLQFNPIREGEVSIYLCGPTVYDDAHLGHARSSLSFDILARTLRALGYRVTLAQNFTDIDDKIIQKIKDTGKTLKEITEYYIDRYRANMSSLAIIAPDIEPKATESIDAIESMISRLIELDFAYSVESGDVYFDTSKDSLYGSISNMVSDDSSTQSRVTHTTQKRNPKDFALWKACGGSEDNCFDTQFSSGRPGWHIECSAMIDSLFEGSNEYTIDIHGGGADLLFPHHENEASQSRCAIGHEVAKYWMHNGFVQIDGEKMSKSLGNSFFLKDALSIYDGEILRYYLGSIHYRNDFNFNEEDLLVAKKRLDRLYRLKKRVVPSTASKPSKEFRKNLLDAMSDDLNISIALSVIDEMIADANERLDSNPKEKATKKETLANIEFVDRLLGFGAKEPYEYFQIGIDEELKEQIELLITQRTKAKKAKEFELSDRIRDELRDINVMIMDTNQGTVWEKI